MTDVLIKKEEFVQRQTLGEDHVKIKAEIRAMHVQGKEYQKLGSLGGSAG